MGVARLKERGAASRFKSADELRAVLDRLLREVVDSGISPRLRATQVPHRFVFTDMDLVLNVAGAEDDELSLRWEFSDDVDWEPELTMEMRSEVANRFLQGRENLAIAVARGEIKVNCAARAALEFLPAARALFRPYTELVDRDYPHLALG